MKRFYNYTFQLVCVYILVLAVFSLFSFDTPRTNKDKKTTHSVNSEEVLDSTLLTKTLGEPEEKKEEIIDEPSNETVVEETYTPQAQVEIPSGYDLSSYPVLSSEVVAISRYGPDCVGCYGGQTAAGYYVGDGRIHYQDGTFGTLRVVAADQKYPLGTVIRITHNGNSFGAIVLDRGGAIGDHGKFQIDLLESSEALANQGGIMYGATLEVLRYGY